MEEAESADRHQVYATKTGGGVHSGDRGETNQYKDCTCEQRGRGTSGNAVEVGGEGDGKRG